MKNLFEFEEFRYKEPSMFTKFVKGVKDFVGVESKKDREEFDNVVQLLLDPKFRIHIGDIRQIGDSIITISLAGKYVYVDKNPRDPQIKVRHKALDLNDLAGESEYLYSVIERVMRSM
jgi:hypothetical protein